MKTLAVVVLLSPLLLSSPVLAQTPAAGSPDCPPIGKTAKGEPVYGMDCKSIITVGAADAKVAMPSTNLPNTVIPKSGATETPPATPPVGEQK